MAGPQGFIIIEKTLYVEVYAHISSFISSQKATFTGYLIGFNWISAHLSASSRTSPNDGLDAVHNLNE